MTDIADASPTPPPAAPTKNTLQRFAGVLFAPAETFQDIARKPDVLGPILLILIISWVSIALTISHMDWDAMIAHQQETMREKNPNMSQADMEKMERITRSMTKVGAWFIWAAPPMMVAVAAIIAGILLLAFRLFGGQGNFMQAWSAVLYSWIPRLILSIIATIVILARGKVDPTQMPMIVKSSPAFLVDMKEHPGLFSLLTSLDIFTIWTIVLLILGFAALSKLSKARAAAIIVSLWLAIILIKSGFAGLMGRMKA